MRLQEGQADVVLIVVQPTANRWTSRAARSTCQLTAARDDRRGQPRA